jgi:predicted ATPase/DNA-binding SARP family transcriptional activator
MGEAPRPRPAVELGVLGALELRRDGAVVPLRSTRQRALLARLLLGAGRVVPLDEIVAALWGDEPSADPRNAVQTYVARLRVVLAEQVPLITREPGYLLDVGPDEVDALRFEELLDQARRLKGQPAAARERLDGALGLWRGPAYAEFAEGFARSEALRLAERRLVALEHRAACRLELGEAAEVAGELEALAGEQPWRERFVELRMRALAALGRDGEALAAYRAYRERLAEEAGLDPSDALAEFEGAILRGELADADDGGGPVVSRPRRPAAAHPAAEPVPAPRTTDPLVGRDEEVAAARAAVQAHRLVTLTGPGGVGKTRIAAEVAIETGPASAGDAPAAWDEVAWVELSALAKADAVPHAVAAAAGVDLPQGRPATDEAVGRTTDASSHGMVGALVDALVGRRLLVVLDNAEHLLGVAAPLAQALTHHAAPVRTLVTSRERLAIDGEHVQPVSPLPTVADDDAEPPAAVRLFAERAAAAGADVHAELPLVEAICRELEGLPLAIELAAARAGAVWLAELQAALAEDASAVVGVRRGQPARHRDLWAVVDWSYRLLDAPLQRLFERFSAFADAVGVDEAHAVCAPGGQERTDTLTQLAELTERSLLVRAGGPGGDARYRMLRPVRGFARQRLADRGERAEIEERHAALLTDRAERAVGPPLTDEGRRWVEASLNDLRAVRNRALLTGDVERLGRLVAALYWFDYWRPGTELLGWADDALAMDGVEALPTAPHVHAAAATVAWMAGDLERARRLAEQGTSLASDRDDAGRIRALEAAGDVAIFEGRLVDAEAAATEVVRLARHQQDPDAETNGLAAVAITRAYTGRPAEAADAADDAARAAARAGPAVHAFARYAQGECRAESDPDTALAHVQEAARLAADCGAWFVEGVARVTAASLRARHGDPAEAAASYAALLRHWRRSGNWTQQWTTLRNVAELLARREVDEAAVVIAAAAETDPSAAPTFGAESDRLDQVLAAARQRLGNERSGAAHRRGRQLRPHDVVDLALTAVEGLSGSTCVSQTAS